ncbi:dynamin family protein [Romboutsia sp.]|uniref:dynamin family protein n=1 Tax=Romboutsia sp. TaxID=1965302 RepID=UPI003F3E1882
MNISFKCNPYTKENIILENNVPYDKNSKLHKYKDRYVYQLNEEFVKDLVDEFNYKELKIKFSGSRYDYENLQILAENYNDNNSNSIKFIEDKILESLDRRDELEQIVSLVEDSQIDDEYKEELINPIKKALSDDIEVAIVATMSAGKSTLINAIVGTKIMPSSPLACTASIVNLKNNKNLNGYKITKINDKIGEKFVDLEAMEDLKELDKVKYIDLEGKIEGLKDIKNLILVDTPGTNNSLNIEHKKTTMDFIKSNKKPIILFILNAEDLLSDDEAQLLDAISREIRRDNEKIDEDRFIFVVNRAEQLRKIEHLQGAVDKVKEGLQEIGIINPNVHYVSAYNSFLSRIDENELDYNEEDDLDDLLKRIRKRVNDERFIKYHKSSTVSQKTSKLLDKQLEEALKDEDYKIASHILSGVKGLEMSIAEIVDKYKNVNLVGNAIDEIDRKMKKQKIQEEIQNQLIQKQEEVDLLQENIQKALSILNSCEIKDNLIQEINELQFPEDMKKVIAKVSSEMNKFASNIRTIETRQIDGCKFVRENTAQSFLNKLSNDVGFLKADLDSEYELYVKNGIYKTGQKVIDKYKNQLFNTLEEIEDFNKVNILTYINLSLPSIKNFVDKNSKLKEIYNPDKRWWKIFTPKYIQRSFVKFSEINEFTMEIQESVLSHIERIKEETQKHKNLLIKQLEIIVSDIDSKIEECMQELNILAENKEALEVAISVDAELVELIDNYKINLEKIRSI